MGLFKKQNLEQSLIVNKIGGFLSKMKYVSQIRRIKHAKEM